MCVVAAISRRSSFMSESIKVRLAQGVRAALVSAGLPSLPDLGWEVPRQPEHGDYATNAAMLLAKPARKAPRQIAQSIVEHFPAMPEVKRLEIAGPGFLNVFLDPAWCAENVRAILSAGEAYARGQGERGR